MQTPVYTQNLQTNTSTVLSVNGSWPGTILITVPCHVELYHAKDNHPLIPSGFPCPLDVTSQLSITHHLPLLWTKIAQLQINADLAQSFRFAKFDEAYNDNWTFTIPHFQAISPENEFNKRLKDIEIKIPQFDHNSTYSFIHLVLIVWLGALTFLFVLLGLCVFRMVCGQLAQKSFLDNIEKDISQRTFS